jgi:hypothetical protein
MPQPATSTVRTLGPSPPASARAVAERIAARQAALAAEARRLSRRRAAAEAVAARCICGARGLPADIAGALALRASRRAAGLHLRFHRAIDALVAAGGFDEAIQILRDRRHPSAARPSLARPPGARRWGRIH